MTSEFRSLIEVVQTMARETPDRPRFTYVNEAGKTIATLNAAQLWDRARQIANKLSKTDQLKRGDRVILVYPPGLEFVEAFLACLLMGVIAVPVSPPLPLRPDVGLWGYTNIVNDCQAVAQLTCRSYSLTRTFGRILQALKSGPKWPNLPWIVTDTIGTKESMAPGSIVESTFEPIQANPTDLAFLQYTSGSTRAPRGVRITHGNLFAQNQLLIAELKLTKDGVSVFWMPHYHDFTLIGGIIVPFYGSHQTILFSAMGFLRRPALWGEVMHHFRAELTGAPDFGYRLLTSKTTAEERSRWDFSSLRTVMNAAEPIRAKTVDAFYDAFAASHLASNTFCPAYGLAEHTLAVLLYGRKRFKVSREFLEQLGEVDDLQKFSTGTNSEVEIFGCGRAPAGVSLKIVDPTQCREVKPGSIGEIWLDSQSKGDGYFGRAEESKQKFSGQLAGSTQKWLRTGDLGAILEDEVVVLGRLDDMITFRGRNLYPQDAEDLVAASDARVRAGRVIAFGIPGGGGESDYRENEIGIVLEMREGHETEKDLTEVAQVIRTFLQQEMGVPQAMLLFVPAGTVPKTTSGKLQRTKCKADWRAGTLPLLKVDRGLIN